MNKINGRVMADISLTFTGRDYVVEVFAGAASKSTNDVGACSLKSSLASRRLLSNSVHIVHF